MITAYVSWYNTASITSFSRKSHRKPQKVRYSKSWTHNGDGMLQLHERVFFFRRGSHAGSEFFMSFHEQRINMTIKHCKYRWFSWNMIINTVNTDAENALAGSEPRAKHIFLCFWPIDKRRFYFIFSGGWLDGCCEGVFVSDRELVR